MHRLHPPLRSVATKPPTPPAVLGRLLVLALASGIAFGCDSADDAEAVAVRYTFEAGDEGWTTGFAAYSEGMASSIGFESEYRADPADFAASDGALFFRGANVS